jgi:hypothetical protein
MSTPFDGQPLLIPDTPDENPLSNGGRFTRIVSAGPGLRREGGHIVPINDGAIWTGEALWNPVFFKNGSICWIVNNISAGGPIRIKLRASADGLTTYYEGSFAGAASWAIKKRVDGGSESTIDSTGAGPSLTTFDRIGFVTVDDGIELWHQTHLAGPAVSPLPDNWTQIVAVTDSDIPGPGYTTLGLGGSETELYGGFGGGLFPIGAEVGARSPSFQVDLRMGSR